MPEWLEVLILAVIEGVTEFLPISSTGHMLIAESFMKHKQSEAFLAIIQSGAVLAVLLVFTQRLKSMLVDWRKPEVRSFILKLGVAFLLTAVGGLILKKAGWELPDSVRPVALATLIGGIVILIIEYLVKGKDLKDSVTWPVAIAIGVGQLVAVVFPGASRSGTTIMMALAMGVNRRAATEFSFLLGIPTLLSAGVLKVYESIQHPTPGEVVQWDMILLGTIVAAITAFIAVKWLLRYVQSHTFVGFGWYRIVLGGLILLLFAR
ncbi:MAG: undecaprenyl-diphosphate phosphatase [Verrucomicrobiales bacterium]